MLTHPLLIIAGPTGVGKTKLGKSVLKQIAGEIISADSRQVYTGLDYITNKFSPGDVGSKRHARYWLEDGIKINLYDVLLPTQIYSAGLYVADAVPLIEKIWQAGQLPIVVGGTGFYINTLLGRQPVAKVLPNEKLRTRYAQASAIELQDAINAIDPQVLNKYTSAELANQKRLLRQLEIVSATDVSNKESFSPLKDRANVLYLILTASRPYLYARADLWVDRLVESTEFQIESEKVDTIHSELKKGLVFKEIDAFRSGEIDQSTMISQMKFSLHRYIRRQLIWFRAVSDGVWYDIETPNWRQQVFDRIQSWYEKGV